MVEKFYWIVPYIPAIKAVLIGAVIGYFTNYLAIKMLFRPRRAYYVGKFRIPLTPGVIPKNKTRMAKVISDIIADKLLTEEDITKILDSEGTKEKLCNFILDRIYNDNVSLSSDSLINDKKENIAEKISFVLSEYLREECSKIDYQTLVKNVIAKSSFNSILSNPLVSMLVGNNFYKSIADSISDYVNSDGIEKIKSVAKDKILLFIDTPMQSNLEKFNITKEELKTIILSIFDKLLIENISVILKNIDIRKIIFDKITLMDIKDFEKLVLQVIKKELNAVINLGAVLGAVIGLLGIVL